MKKVFAFVILLAVIVSSFACSAPPNSKEVDATTVSASDASEATTTEPQPRPELPVKDYEGYEFKFLISGNSELKVLRNDFKAENETGDVINDARYARNKIIEDAFNIKISTIEKGEGSDIGYNEIRKAVNAGDSSYDAAMVAGYASCKLASGGFLSDLNTLPYVDLSKPWWDQKANQDLTIKGKMYYTTGDISTANNDATYCILFNKKLVKDYSLPDMYTLVKEGKWTVDQFAQITSAVHKDLDGNGIYDTNDLYGALIWDDSMMGIVNSAGEKCCKVGDDGSIQLTLFSDKVIEMFNKYIALVEDKGVCHAYQRKNWDGIAANNMFSQNQALFFVELLSKVTVLRGMADDFGVLPYFKLNEAQESYYNTVGSWHSVFLCVPTTTPETERTGIILEALAGESRYTVRPAYYDIALKGKYARDEESREMLDIILSTRTYDLGWFYAVGGYNEEIMNLFRNFKTDFTSMYQKYEAKAGKDIDKLNTAFSEVLN